MNDLSESSAGAGVSSGLLCSQGGLCPWCLSFLAHFSEDTWDGTLRALRRADRFIRKKRVFMVGSAADLNGSWPSFPRSWTTGGAGPQSLPRTRPAQFAKCDYVKRLTKAAAPQAAQELGAASSLQSQLRRAHSSPL